MNFLFCAHQFMCNIILAIIHKENNNDEIIASIRLISDIFLCVFLFSDSVFLPVCAKSVSMCVMNSRTQYGKYDKRPKRWEDETEPDNSGKIERASYEPKIFDVSTHTHTFITVTVLAKLISQQKLISCKIFTNVSIITVCLCTQIRTNVCHYSKRMKTFFFFSFTRWMCLELLIGAHLRTHTHSHTYTAKIQSFRV